MDRLSSGYTSTEGQKVIDSFRPGTHPGDVSLAENVGDFVVSAAADLVLQRVGGKVVDRIASAVDGKLHVPKTDSGVVGDGPKGVQKLPELGGVDAFLGSQAANLNKKLGTKIGEGRLPYEASRAGVEQAKLAVKDTLENATAVSDVIPKSTVRGGYDLIHIYSSKTNSTVSLRVLPGGKYEFDTLIPEKSSKF